MTDRLSSSTIINLSELAAKAAQVLDTLDAERAYDLLLIKQSDEWTLVAKAVTREQEAESQSKTWRIKTSLA